MMKLKNNWLLLFFVSTLSWGQNFEYQANLKPVKYTGFHKVVLSPELLGKLNNNNADIRLYDSLKTEIPYIHDQEIKVEYQSLFNEYEIVEKNYSEDKISYLIFHNIEKKAINNVSFIVKNTDVRKRARLSGSDDKENWYVIKNNYLLHSMYNNSETSEFKILNFPRSNYEFFKLEINDYWKLPINILNVGYYDTKSIEGKKIVFDCPIVSTKDSIKTTFIKIDFPEKVYLENLQFELEGADYYLRKGSVYIQESYQTKRKKTKTYFKELKSFELNSNSENDIILPAGVRKTLYLEIYNKDDQPLKVKNIKASYLKKYLLADLKPDNRYTLQFGDKKIKTPQYDLANFRNEIPKDIATVNHDKISNRVAKKEVGNATDSIFENKYVVWGIISLVGILLLFVSFKMIKEIGNKN